MNGIKLNNIPRDSGIKVNSVEKFIKLLGWIITEGSTKSNKSSVNITQNKGVKQRNIKELLDDLKLDYNEYIYGNSYRYYIKNKQLRTWMVNNIGEENNNKYIPIRYKNLNKQQLQLLLDRKSTRLNSSHIPLSRMPSSA